MLFKCGTCCKGCVVCSDDFNRTAGDTVGNGWNEDVGDWDIVATASGEGALQNTNYPATLTRETSCGTNPPPHTITIDYLGTPTPFPRSSSVTVKWTPLNTYDPSTHRLYLGNRNAIPGAIDDGIFVQVKYYLAVTASIRLGNRVAGVDTWLTDELTIGDRTPTYAGSGSWASGEPQFQVTLCWEPVEFYYGVEMWRSYRKVTASITTPTTAVYTLEAMAINACDMIPQLEAVDGYARWDDLVWSITKPDAPACPYCGQCLFAADMTTADDSGTWAYTSSGGTFARNASGDLELTSTTATWLVDLPARNSLSLNYSADWSGSSPTFDVEIGAIRLQISKTLTPEQVIAVTVNGSGAASIYTSLTNSTLTICFNAEKIVVATATTHNEYTSSENTGYVNLQMTAGSSKVTVTEIRALRADDTSVATLGCTPCDLDTDPDCSVCPPAAFAPYGAVIVTHDTTYDEYTNYWGAFTFPATPPALGDSCAGVTPTPCEMSQGPDMLPNALVCEIGGTCAVASLDVSDTLICCWTFNDQRTVVFTACNDNMYVAALMAVVLYKTADTIPRFYLAARFLQNSTWSFTPAGGTVKLWRCVGGNVAGFTTDLSLGDAAGSIAYHTVDTGTAAPLYYSDYFTDCDKVDFALTRVGAGTLRGFFWDMNFPSSINIHVPR